MTEQQASLNRRITQQLTIDTSALPLADDIILHDFAQSTTITGRQAVLAFIRAFFQHAFANRQLNVDTLLADGQAAALSLSIAGRQIAPFWGLPCTGRPVTLSLALICHFQAEQITRIELYYDAGTLLRQLGLAL
ncbi:MAG: hypothetical protein Kow0031_25940 [Anaerolineae bacterium]